MKFDRRISRRSFLAAAGVTSAALALTACGGSSSSTAASSAASGASSAAAGTAQGGTLNIMLETEVQSLDPQVATDGTSFEVIADYTDGLMQMDADGAAVPAMAETYDISEDGKTYTFHLRDAKWSNGEAVTAADSNNYGLWSDADYDAIIDECTIGDLCTDPEGRWAALYEAEQIVLEQAVIFPLYGQCNAEMISSAVKGVEHHPCALNRVYKNTTKSE